MLNLCCFAEMRTEKECLLGEIIHALDAGDGVEGWTGRGRGNGRKLSEKWVGEEPEGGMEEAAKGP